MPFPLLSLPARSVWLAPSFLLEYITPATPSYALRSQARIASRGGSFAAQRHAPFGLSIAQYKVSMLVDRGLDRFRHRLGIDAGVPHIRMMTPADDCQAWDQSCCDSGS